MGEKMDKTIAHLGFIQSIVARMGANSFLLKGWSVTLVAALFALSASDADHKFVLLAYFPAFMFWGLDGYFLYQERLFRKLYEEVAAGRIASAEFTLDTQSVSVTSPSMAAAIFSKTLVVFHGTIVAVVLFAMFVLMAA